jgi:hypothetical protein
VEQKQEKQKQKQKEECRQGLCSNLEGWPDIEKIFLVKDKKWPAIIYSCRKPRRRVVGVFQEIRNFSKIDREGLFVSFCAF